MPHVFPCVFLPPLAIPWPGVPITPPKRAKQTVDDRLQSQLDDHLARGERLFTASFDTNVHGECPRTPRRRKRKDKEGRQYGK